MRAPFSFWKPSTAVFNPATLSLSGWWRANYTGAPWAAVASAGTSLANGDMTSNANDPATGTAQNGLTPADFDGTNDNLRNLTDITSFVTTTAGTVVCLFRGDTAANATGNIYDDAPLFLDSNADFGLTFTNSGLAGFAYDGGYKTKAVACATGAYHLVMMTVDTSNISMTLDSASAVTQACGTLAVLTGAIGTGQGYGATHYFDGRILELMTATTKLSATDYGNIKSYCNSRYALSL